MRIMVFMKRANAKRSRSQFVKMTPGFSSSSIRQFRRGFVQLFCATAFALFLASSQPTFAAPISKTGSGDASTFTARWHTAQRVEAVGPVIGLVMAVALTHILQRRRITQVTNFTTSNR